MKWHDIVRHPAVRQAVVELVRAVVVLAALLLLGPEAGDGLRASGQAVVARLFGS